MGGADNDDIDASGPLIDGGDGDDNIVTYRDFSGGVSAVSVTGGDGNDTITTSSYGNGSALGVTLDGGTGNDSISGTGMTDGTPEVLIGGDGNDTLRGNNGNDMLQGGADNDSLFGGNQDDTLEGGTGDDTLQGDAGNDLIDGGSGGEVTGDVLVVGGERDRFALVDGGSGTIIVIDRDGSLGRDTVSGVETLRFTDGDVATAGLALGQEIIGTNPAGELLTGTLNDDIITGLGGNDTINGLDGGDVIDGGDGDNTVDAGAGNDEVTTGAGSDTVTAGAGDDDVFAGDGDDSVDGGTENDSLLGGSGNDTLLGGDGNDTIGNYTVDGDDSIEGGAGNDVIQDYYGQNTVLGGAGNDTIIASGPLIDGGDGDDNIVTYRDFSGGVSAVSVTGGDGNDTITTSSYGNGSALGVTLDGGTGNDSISGTGMTEGTPEVLIGGDGNDTLRGNNGNDMLQGGADNDSLFGGNQDDTLEGGTGDDTLQGDAGNDIIEGGAGTDFITGGTGDDTIDGGGVNEGNTVFFSGASTNYIITTTTNQGEATVQDTVGSDGTDTLTNVSILRFTDQDVVIGPNPGISDTGDGGPNTLTGTPGDDTLSGLGGNDSLIGDAGSDSLIGGDDNDTLLGDLGTDTLEGGAGNDSLIGGGQSDTLLGGDGNDSIGNFTIDGDDSIEGGAGADRIWDYYGQNTVLGGADNDDIDASGPLIDGGDGDDNIVTYRDFSGGVSAVSVTGGDGNDTITTSSYGNGSALGVTLDGGTGNDSISGTGMTDGTPEVLIGGDGNDTLRGNNGNDMLQGGADNDSLFGGNQDDTLEGGTGDDTLQGDAGNDLIDGGSGGEVTGDVLVVGGERDRFALVDGGSGTIIVIDRDGSLGRDTVSGVETLRFTDGDVATAGLALGQEIIGTNPAGELLTGTLNDDIITGLGGNDTINGLDGGDVIDGGDGDNTVDAGAGNDEVTTGAGSDTVTAGAGDDDVFAGDGDDSVDGGTENDSLLGGSGNDTLLGGDGNDTIGNYTVDGDDSIEGGAGNDVIQDYYGQNTVLGGAGNDTIIASGPLIDGGDGDDNIVTYRDFSGGVSAVSVTGGDGNDTITTSSYGNGSALGVTLDGGTGNDSISGTGMTEGTPEVLIGGDGNDTLRGNNGNDMLQGGADNDSLFGGNQDDTLEGGTGDDTLQGDQGDDTIDGGTEATDDGDIVVFSGARGNYSVIGNQAGLTVVDNVGNNGTDTVINAERLRFSDGDIIVATGLVGANIVGTEFDDNGQPGNPGALVGTILNDTISGLDGDDSLVGLAGIDLLDGGDGDDTIDGGSENDTIDAGAGDDNVIGGEGDNSIAMGDGRDIAVFAGDQTDYSIVGDRFSVTVTDLDPLTDGDDGTDIITGARILRFTDGDVFLNAAPLPDAESFVTDEDIQIVIPIADLLDGDVDPDGDPLSIIRVDNESNGTAVIIGPNIVFTPGANFNGTATFEYVVSDTFAEVNQSVTINVNPINDAPLAASDSATTDEDTSVAIDLLDNDTDVDGDNLTVSMGTPSNGSVIFDGEEFIYTPDADFNGLDSFTYTIDDGNGGSDTATVTVTVNPVNDAPVVLDDNFAVGANTTLNVIASGVLANDTDIEGDPLTAVLDSGPSDGSLTLNADGSFDYTPDAGFVGIDTFTYFANDGFDDSLTAAIVTITVTAAPNTPPEAMDDSASTDEDTSVGIDLLANDTDDDGDNLTVSLGTPSNGSVIFDGEEFIYTPDADFNGLDSFTYTIDDGNGGSDTATVTVTVNPVNDAPVANDDSGTTDEDTSVAIDLLDNDTDVDGDNLTVSLGTPSNGSVIFDGEEFIYTPDADFNGLDTFTYTIDDGNGGSDTATVTVTVNPVNDAPVANDDSGTGFTTDEDTSFTTASVLTNDTDVDVGDILTVLGIDTTGTIGSVIDNGDGTFDYDPNGMFEDLASGDAATDSFSYTVSDGNGGTDTAVVTITVEGEDDVPLLNPIIGTQGNDFLIGTDAADAIRSLGGTYDRMRGGDGEDQFVFGAESSNGRQERDLILDYVVGEDSIVLESGTTVNFIRESTNMAVIYLDGDRDVIYVRGDGVNASNLSIINDGMDIV